MIKPAHGARTHRQAGRSESFHEVGAISGIAGMTKNELKTFTPRTACSVAARSTIARCRCRRRFHRARRLRRCLNLREADDGRADGTRFPATDHSRDRRIGGGGSVKTIRKALRTSRAVSAAPHGIGRRRRTWRARGRSRLGLRCCPVRRVSRPAITLSHQSSAMFVAGPPVVARLGQSLDKQELAAGRSDQGRRRRSCGRY